MHHVQVHHVQVQVHHVQVQVHHVQVHRPTTTTAHTYARPDHEQQDHAGPPPHIQMHDFTRAPFPARTLHVHTIRARAHTHTHIHTRAIARAQNNKDYFDQSLDEIKLLKFINTLDPEDAYGLVRLYDFFYYKVCWVGGGG